MCHPILPMKSPSQPGIATAILSLFSPIFPSHTPNRESRCPRTFPHSLKTSILSMLKQCASPSTHVVLTKVCSSFSSLPSRLASRSLVQQQASHREISELRRTIPRSECILAFPPRFLLDGVATTWADKVLIRLCWFTVDDFSPARFEHAFQCIHGERALASLKSDGGQEMKLAS